MNSRHHLMAWALLCTAAILGDAARADIYRWDNGQLIPGTEGITPGPGVQLDNRQLEFARLWDTNLTDANFASANLSNAMFVYSTLANANLTGAKVTGAILASTTPYGFTKEQLYSTASYQERDLQGLVLATYYDAWFAAPNNLVGSDFNGQDLTGASFDSSMLTNVNLAEANLTNASLYSSALTNANLTGAIVTGANFGVSFEFDTARALSMEQLYSTASYHANDLTGIGLSRHDLTGWDFGGQDITGADLSHTKGFIAPQLYSTASYQAKNLRGIALSGIDLTSWDFRGQDLTGASLAEAKVANANLIGAIVAGADISFTTSRGFTKEQLYSTGSYQAKDLRGIGLGTNNLIGWDFRGQNLTDADFTSAIIATANLSNADTRGATGLNLTAVITTNLIRPDGEIAGLNLVAGERLIASPGVALPVHFSGGFSIAPDATFDLTDNDLIVRATAATKDALHAEVQAKVKSAQNGVDAEGLVKWDGFGVTSSAARAANVAAGVNLVGLGVIRNSDLDITTGLPGSSHTTFSGRSVSPHDVLVKYTYTGDGNLDGVVNFDDYAAMDAAFFGGIPNLGWATGDINFDGVLNFDDYSAVDQAFFLQEAPLVPKSGGLSPVPEPAALTILSLGALAALTARWQSYRLSLRRRPA
jgi:uncharacterized protein YjbI with pentapeptide repeats